MTCAGCATRSGWTSRSCSAAASAGTWRSPTRGCSPITPAASSWPTPPGAAAISSASSRRSAASAAPRQPPSRRALTLMRPGTIRLSSSGSATRFTAARPAGAGESRQFLARMIKNMDVSLHYASQQASGFDPWTVTGAVRCPVLVLTGEDDPICPLPVVEELAGRTWRRPPAW